MRSSLYKNYLKRGLDLASSVFLVILTSPLLILIACLLRIYLGPHIIFKQSRLGLRGKPFTIYKFRSMKEVRDSHGNLLPDCERLSKIGAFVRSTSLDELPQLFNILRGEMSLIGPRPLYSDYWNLFNNEQKRRCDVRPGITGYAQVKGRNTLSWPERLALDVWYVDNVSPLIDLKIFVLTIIKVVMRSDINQPGVTTQEKFMGNG